MPLARPPRQARPARAPTTRLRAHADDDEDIIPLLAPRRNGFTQKELDALSHPHTLGGKTVGEELGERGEEEKKSFFSSPLPFSSRGKGRDLSFPIEMEGGRVSHSRTPNTPTPTLLHLPALIRTQYIASEASAAKGEARLHTASKGGNWEGDVYVGSAWNLMTVLGAVGAAVPLAGLAFALATKGVLWGLVDYYGY